MKMCGNMVETKLCVYGLQLRKCLKHYLGVCQKLVTLATPYVLYKLNLNKDK